MADNRPMPFAPAAPGATHDPEAFARLSPDLVLDALYAVGLVGDGRLTPLSSYENRVYQAHLEDGSAVIAKFYRPDRWSDDQILEEHAFAADLAQAEVPAVGPLRLQGATLHHHAGFAFAVSPRRGGRAPELEDFDVLEWIGRFLARIHAVGAQRPFRTRPVLGLHPCGELPRAWLLEHDRIPLDVRSDWERRSEEALTMLRAHPALHDGGGRAGADGADAIQRLRLHGDCHIGNILWTPLDVPAAAGPGPHFVDLDDACTGPAVQDLWMLLSGDRPQRTRQLAALIDGYEQFRPFDRRELALIEPLRTLRQISYSAWLAQRWQEPVFRHAFPWFGSSDYWRGQVQMLEEQLEAMQEDPLVA